jgi:Kdo2-lipid IVA lauroyltransferase/acyltransferase
MSDKIPFQPVAYLTNLALRGLIGTALLMPYRWRIPFVGCAVSRLVAPIAGWGQRVRDNLALILPDLPAAEVNRLARAVPNNLGRMVIELYSGAEFKAHVRDSAIKGDGLAAILAAQERGQGVILVSGHFGNYDVPRAVLSAQGHAVAGLYMPFKNPYFTRHYVKTITAIGAPVFERGRRGLAEMVKHLRKGGLVGMLIDQHMSHGEPLTFFGKPAKTALSAAELALKYNCLLVPIYGVRLADGISFDLVIEPPIPHSTPQAMTQALNDSLEAITRDHLDQWFWIHRRWK